MSGIFGNMFDFNRDGKLDCTEQAMEFMVLNELLKEEKASDDIFDDDPDDDADDGW